MDSRFIQFVKQYLEMRSSGFTRQRLCMPVRMSFTHAVIEVGVQPSAYCTDEITNSVLATDEGSGATGAHKQGYSSAEQAFADEYWSRGCEWDSTPGSGGGDGDADCGGHPEGA
jgi:hypothetical protein